MSKMPDSTPLRYVRCPPLPPGDLWLFAYGSLMWNPEFAFVRAVPAVLHGYHRSFCVYSTRYRGTPESPGLVLGLDRGGSCRGVAFLVEETAVAGVLDTLWAREMNELVYHARVIAVEAEGNRINALTFVADREHQNYAGRLDVQEIARTIAECTGARGPNADYLFNTLRHLHALGIRERRLDTLSKAVQVLQTPRTRLPA
jgi:glutathione-specific gamma-glutamylcyclotransferase